MLWKRAWQGCKMPLLSRTFNGLSKSLCFRTKRVLVLECYSDGALSFPIHALSLSLCGALSLSLLIFQSMSRPQHVSAPVEDVHRIDLARVRR